MSNSIRTGSCACGRITFQLVDEPFIIQACHCTDCRKLSGGAFVVNAWSPAHAVEVTKGAPKSAWLKGGSGEDHELFFCEECGTNLWSRYYLDPKESRFVRVEALDDPASLPVALHIFVRSKHPEVEIPQGATTFETFYDPKEVWPAETLARYRAQ